MEQRRLRLGDILDDYCPRERRVTNHAVVAMIEEDVKQTRCTTCDAEHAYKGARVPTRRKKETTAALYKEVLAGLSESTENNEVPLLAAPAAPALASVVTAVPPVALVPADVVLAKNPAATEERAIQAVGTTPEEDADRHEPESEQAAPSAEFAPADGAPVVDGPVHRPLIRATLPRIEGQKEARPVPDFTIRHTPPRGNGNGHGGFRGDRDRMRVRGGNGNAYGHASGNRANGGPRFHGNRPQGSGRQPMGRAGGPPPGFRGNGNGNGNKRGRGSRG